MAMKALVAREIGTDFVVRVHLDDTKMVRDPGLPPPGTDAQGNPLPDTRPFVPDPAWVETWRWGTQPPAGRTRTQYLADIRREMKALAQIELAKRQAAAGGDPGGTALSFEGQVL